MHDFLKNIFEKFLNANFMLIDREKLYIKYFF